MIKIDTHELAWAAGFFDGEGSTTKPSGRARSMAPVIQLGQAESFPLERFVKAVGFGYIRTYKDKLYKKWYFYMTITKFEHSQQAICMLWKWLGPTKKAQYKKIAIPFIKNHIKNNYSMNPKAIESRYRYHHGTKAEQAWRMMKGLPPR
jgi:hypothetical protein